MQQKPLPIECRQHDRGHLSQRVSVLLGSVPARAPERPFAGPLPAPFAVAPQFGRGALAAFFFFFFAFFFAAIRLSFPSFTDAEDRGSVARPFQ
jgi:hypothetical protein